MEETRCSKGKEKRRAVFVRVDGRSRCPTAVPLTRRGRKERDRFLGKNEFEYLYVGKGKKKGN